MRLFKSALFSFVFFIIAPSLVFAAIIPTPEPDPCANPLATESSFEGAGFSTVPAMECIDETIQKVTVTFHNLTGGEEYKICAGGEFCLKDQAVLPVRITQKLVTDDEFEADPNGDVSVTVCGRNKSLIKTGDDCGKGDYFHGGHTYLFSIGIVDDGKYLLSTKAGFYVARSYPNVRISPTTGITTNDAVNVSLTDTSPRPGGGKRNNYQVLIKGSEFYEEEECFTLDKGETRSTSFDKTLPVGKFTIEIKEQVNEGGIRQDHCQGGFTYYKIACKATNPGDGGGICADPEDSKDPESEEYKAFLEDLARLNGAGGKSFFPCGDGVSTNLDPVPLGECPSIKSAIGDIEVIPERFVGSVFQFVLTIATFGAIILIIYSGYLFMMSSGDKEKLAGARETITSAIVGLLFIILSFIILEIIGFDILRIPGFGK